MAQTPLRILIGWREWVALPDLELPVIKAKLDTGAKTSSLHAFDIEPFFERDRLKVNFRVHPLNGHPDIFVRCAADVIDYRYVSDSGGHREKRYVILTHLQIGDLKFPIEVTLANRETMTHKMLIGRTAMKHLMIDPGRAFLLGKPERILSAYKPSPKIKKTKKKSKGK